MIKKITILLLVFSCVQSFAQKTNSSPYSVLGIGDGVSSKTVEEMSMGGVGNAVSTPNEINFSNPATYAHLLFTTYSIAGNSRSIKLTDSNGDGKSSTTQLSYIAMGIPLGEKAGFGFGLQPNTSVGYRISNKVFDTNNEIINASLYEGKGGTNRVFLGFGYKLSNELSAGIESEYIFGTVENTILNQLKDVQLGTKYSLDSKVNGNSLKMSLLYKKKLKEKLFLHLGTTFKFGHELKTEGNEYLYSVAISGSSESPRDTIVNNASSGKYKTPLKTGLGVAIGNPSVWLANIDYDFQKAIDVSGNIATSNPRLAYTNSSKLSIGGYYIPRYNSISNYFERVVYRAGIRMEKSGIMVDGTGNGTNFNAIDDFGISFGVGLPMGNQISRLNLGFEFGKRGTTSNGLIEEKYFNFRLGLSLSNKWFNKREIN